MQSFTTAGTTIRMSGRGEFEIVQPGLMWLLRAERVTRHPGPCGHSYEQSCMTVTSVDPMVVFWSKQAAKRFATRKYDLSPDEWIEGSPDDDFLFVIRISEDEEQLGIYVFDADLDPAYA